MHVFARETVSFMHDQPGQFATLFARNFAYFWWLAERAGLLYPSSWLAVTRRHLLATLAPPGVCRGRHHWGIEPLLRHPALGGILARRLDP